MQWKNTNSVIDCFQNISNKKNCSFIQLDIKDFYPSITEKTKQGSITFAKQYVNIREDHIRIINHFRKSLLFNNVDSLKKKSSDSYFDVAMGSYYGGCRSLLIDWHIYPVIYHRYR